MRARRVTVLTVFVQKTRRIAPESGMVGLAVRAAISESALGPTFPVVDCRGVGVSRGWGDLQGKGDQVRDLIMVDADDLPSSGTSAGYESRLNHL